MDRPAAGEVPRPRPPGRARPGRVPLRGRRLLLRAGRRGRRVVRLVALRRPRLPVPEAVGGDRLRRPRRHARHLRRDPARLLDPVRAPRRHGRQPRRRVDLLPEHAPPLLRPGLLRAGRQGPRPALRAGLQRLDARRVVGGRGQGPAAPADDRPAVGPRAGRRRGASLRRQGQPRHRLQREPAPARPAVGARRGALGPAVRGVRGDRHGRVHAHRVELEDAGDVARRAVHRVEHADVLERDGLDARLHLLRHARALPRPCASPTARGRSGGCPTCSSGPTSSGPSGATTASARRSRTSRRATCTTASTAASSTTRSACATATSSAWTRSASRPTTPTPTRRSRTRRRSPPTSSRRPGCPTRRPTSSSAATPSAASASTRFGITS